MKYAMMSPADLLELELRQAGEEFVISEEIKEKAKAVMAMPAGPERDAEAGKLYAEIQKLPLIKRRHFPQESNDLEWIIEHSPALYAPIHKTVAPQSDRIAGGWFGRAIGRKAAGAQNTDYAKLNLGMLEKHGKDFSTQQVFQAWKDAGEISGAAEQIALANYAGGIPVPKTAVCCNPFRESAGAISRADVYGYLNLGRVLDAAKMAWKDAAASHIKSGIYGSMMLAQMIALAAFETDPKVICEKSLVGLPIASRFFVLISWMVRNYVLNVDWETCLKEIRDAADSKDPYTQENVLPNACVIVAALCYGKGDFEKTLNYALETGFDTVTNAAAVCSVLGVMLGKNAIPPKMLDTLDESEISEADRCAAKTEALARA